MLSFERPDRIARFSLTLLRWGTTLAGGYIGAAARYPDATALIDEHGSLTFAQVNERTDRLANALIDDGLTQGDCVAVMCRNHRGFIEALVAASKVGADALLLNTSFAGPQLATVMKREDPRALIYDSEFGDLIGDGGKGRKRYVVEHEAVAENDEKTAKRLNDPVIERMIESGSSAPLDPPAEPGGQIVLTSGTTGDPKGARRSSPQSLDPALALLQKIPLRKRGTTVVSAPLFHAWGFAHFMLSVLLSATLVLDRKFDARRTLELVERHRADALAVVPVMLQRILELPPAQRRYDTSSLKIVASSGSALTGPLAERFMGEFGDVLYNLYGATEVAWIAIATPKDLREAPDTAGRAPFGTSVKIVDEDGLPVETGTIGQICVGSVLPFEGYTSGETRTSLDGMTATGDMGRLDASGRLFVEGRDDDMIVSGGENVYPVEVESLISSMAGVTDVAVVGVSDDQFGQRLKAWVVKSHGTDLTERQIKDHVKANLAGYKVPRQVEFVDELARNATGKILRRELRK